MIRWVVVVLLSLTWLSPASASLARKQYPELRKGLPTRAVEAVQPPSADDEYRVTEQTEILLDGRPCRYEQVPDGATIVLMEIDSHENKEVLKLHFSTVPRRTKTTTTAPR